MATIREQITKPNIGAFVDLFHVDLNPIGVATEFYFTPSSRTPILFNGETYNPFPIELGGADRNVTGAPSRVTMKVSNVNQMVAAAVITYGDMVGGHVTYTRTLENFLDGAEDGGTSQSFPVQRYIILQKSAFSQQSIEFTLGTELDRPGLMLPRRQCLKTNVGKGGLWCPGMIRTRL
jgi:lambda family phage minor tail protein L